MGDILLRLKIPGNGGGVILNVGDILLGVDGGVVLIPCKGDTGDARIGGDGGV